MGPFGGLLRFVVNLSDNKVFNNFTCRDVVDLFRGFHFIWTCRYRYNVSLFKDESCVLVLYQCCTNLCRGDLLYTFDLSLILSYSLLYSIQRIVTGRSKCKMRLYYSVLFALKLSSKLSLI